MEFFYSLKNKILNHFIILLLKNKLENINKNLEKNKFWNKFLIYYKKFDARGNAIMDELEAHVEMKKKEFFAQNEEEYQQFYNDVKVTLSWTWLIWINIMMWQFIFPAAYCPFKLEDAFISYDKLYFPPNSIVHAMFHSYDRIHNIMFFDKPFRNYNPPSFTIDFSDIPVPENGLILFVFVFFFSMLNVICALILAIIDIINDIF